MQIENKAVYLRAFSDIKNFINQLKKIEALIKKGKTQL